MSKQLDFFPDPVITDDRKRRLVLDVFACKKVCFPNVNMTVIEMGPVQIQAGINIINRYLEEDTVETSGLDKATEGIEDSIIKMTAALDEVLV